MPYDDNGRWIPPTEADAWRTKDSLTRFLRETGELERNENLADIFTVGEDDWEDQNWELHLNEEQRFKVLELYKEDYISGREFAEDWGLQFEREGFRNYNSPVPQFSGRNSDLMRYNALIGDGYDIDYAHYNENLAYRAAWADLSKTDSWIGAVTDRIPFTTPRQIMAAKAKLEEPGYDYDPEWVRNNAMPYGDAEQEALEDFAKHNQTRHWDPETNITTFFDPQDTRSLSAKLYQSRAAGNFTQLTEPGAPQNLHVVAGEVPEAVYNSEGTRMIADGDVRAMYTRYLGRNHAKLVDTNIDINDPSHDPTAIGRDEIAYWEASARVNNWTYDDLVGTIKKSGEASQNIDRGPLYYNINAGKEDEIRGKLTAEPEPINPPDLTIRKVQLQRPDNIDTGWRVPGVQ